MKVYLNFLLLFISCGSLLAQSTSLQLNSNQATLKALEADGKFGISIELTGTNNLYRQLKPMAVEVVDNNNAAQWLEGAYTQVQVLNNTLECTGTITSINGSVFSFTDIYSAYDASGTFEIKRTVNVTTADSRDKGFSTRLAFQRPVTSAMLDYDFFVPSVWYKDNTDVSANALASNYTDNDYWFREDRLPLPLIMLREKNTGVTFSVFHKDADGATFNGEDGLNRIIDGRMKFASVGMRNNQQPLVGILFPGTEGERTGIYGMSNTKRWAYRSNPVTLNYTQNYNLTVRLNQEDNYLSALKNTWNKCYQIQNPAFYQVDLDKVYAQQIDILDSYWRLINGAAGVPFRIRLNGTVDNADYNYNMGFVGQQIANGALLIREGLNSSDVTLKSKGEQIVDFWADKSLASSGIPRIWYDPSPQTWRNMPTHLRNVGDGMNGLLYAWNLEKKNGTDKGKWLKTASKVADWLLSVQNTDGSFYQQYDVMNGSVMNNTKNNTSNVVPFLVDLYNITGTDKYKQAALKAGGFIYQEIHQNFKYAGGAADNPNVPDKEAVSMALRAFLALYDLDKNNSWLDASKQAAYYYQTWVYSWDVPLPQDDASAIFPKNRSVTGLSLIATANNAADSYAAIDAFNIYRVYLYAQDENLLNFSKLLLQNTKQYVNWNTADPIPGFAPGFLGEALTVLIPRGRGVGYYLPWQAYNLLEPMVLFKDVFGAFDINTIQNSTPAAIKTAHDNYAINRDFEKGTIMADAVAQTISFSTIPSKFIGDEDFDPEAIASSGLPVIYTSSNSNVATIVNNKVHVVGAGKTNITATQPGNEQYLPAVAVARELIVNTSDVALNINKILSPNGDGQNDFLNIPGSANMLGNSLVVVNRSGNKVFQIDNYDNHTRVFTGKNNAGKNLPEGTYFYTFVYQLNNKKESKSGYIILKY